MIGEAIFPFTALVGQEPMKRALILAAIHPGLGGVLIRGSKGAAKSTAVRALAALLPPIDVHEGDPFRRAPGEAIPGWPLPEDAPVVRRPVALVNLPVGATDDRVVGSLNLERALSTGARAFEPGLLAAAHRGILYIDEVNLLGDHLVDLLLDAAAMGVNHVEREGLAFRHPARFVLVGTMNPEEGDLRPQLLDRFGLAVEADPMTDPRLRAEVVRRRLAFEADPPGFLALWADSDRAEGAKIAAARDLLPAVVVPDAILDVLCTRCAREGAEGLRADLTIHKAAAALAAYDGRTTVTLADVDAVAELALAHRRTNPGPPPQGPAPSPPPGRDDDRPDPGHRPPPPRSDYLIARDRPDDPCDLHAQAEPNDGQDDPGDPLPMPASEPGRLPDWTPRLVPPRRPARSGRRGRPTVADHQGPYIRSAVPAGRASDPALDAMLRAAAPHQVARGRSFGQNLILRPADLRIKVRARPSEHLILFAVDASRSMGARERMRRTKGAVLSLLIDAYQKRDRVGLITFGRGGPVLALPPTRSVRVAARQLADLPVGGLTPLAGALALAARVVASARRREPGVLPLVVLLTDGRGNVPIQPGGNPEADALAMARQLKQLGIAGLVIDTESGPVQLGMARALAHAWGAEAKGLDELQGSRLPEAVRRVLFERIA